MVHLLFSMSRISLLTYSTCRGSEPDQEWLGRQDFTRHSSYLRTFNSHFTQTGAALTSVKETGRFGVHHHVIPSAILGAHELHTLSIPESITQDRSCSYPSLKPGPPSRPTSSLG